MTTAFYAALCASFPPSSCKRSQRISPPSKVISRPLLLLSRPCSSYIIKAVCSEEHLPLPSGVGITIDLAFLWIWGPELWKSHLQSRCRTAAQSPQTIHFIPWVKCCTVGGNTLELWWAVVLIFKLTEFRIHWDTGTGHAFITLVDVEGRY